MTFFEDLANEMKENVEEGLRKVLLVAVGSAGCKVVKENMLADNSVLGEKTCDIQSICIKDKNDDLRKLEDEISKFDAAIVFGYLGGETTLNILPQVVEILSKSVPVTTMLTRPFEFEGEEERVRSEKVIDYLKKYPNALILKDCDNAIKGINQSEKFEDDVLKENMSIPLHHLLRLISKKNEICFNKEDLSLACDFKEDNRAFMRKYDFLTLKNNDDFKTKIEELCIPDFLKEAKVVLMNITISEKLSFLEFNKIVNTIKSYADNNVRLIFGLSYDSTYVEERADLMVLATGFSHSSDIFERI